MADPISIIGLVSSVIDIATAVNNYISSYRAAPMVANILREEVSAVDSLLAMLRKTLQSQAGADYKTTCVLFCALNGCNQQLQIIQKKLIVRGPGKLGQIVHRLKWPFSEKETRDAADTLHQFTQLFHFAITMEGLTALTQSNVYTQDEVTKITWKLDGIALTDDNTFRELMKISKLVEKLPSFENEMNKIASALGNMAHEKVKDDEKAAVLRALKPLSLQEKHMDLQLRRTEGLGQWLLALPDFVNWREGTFRSNTLWCYGNPGAGKTFLSSTIIDHLEDRTSSSGGIVLYFYFDYVEQTTQTPLNILSTLLHQLLSQLEALPDTVSLLLARVRQNKPLPSWKQMIDIFIATANNQDEVFLVLDALDESDPNKNREKVLELLDYIFDQSNIRALITSRPFPSDIKSAFASLPKVVIAASKDDIRTFLTHKIASSRRAWIKKEVDDILRERIIYTLTMKSQGMFLLPALEIDNILGQTNRTQLIQCLNALPSGIEGNLGLTMQRIRTQDSQGDSKATLAMRILTLLCTSRQPLQVQGLQYAIATSPQSEKLDDLTDESMILECCHGLIKIDAETYIVRFVHMSIFEYLSARRDEFFPKGEATVAMNCMRHLTLIGKSKASIDIKFDPFVNSFFNPFLRYASLSWGDHAAVDFGDTVEHQTLQLLNDATALCIWSNIYRPYHTYWASFPPTPANITRPSFAPLHVAAIFDIPQLCKKELARSTTDPNVQDHQQRTPLMFAAAHGAHKVLSILLSRDDVDVNKTDIFGQTALVVAVLYGTLETMRPLLESPRLDVNSGLYTDQVCQTDDASELEKVKLLLTSRPELDVNNDQAPLWYLLTYKEEYEALQIVFDRPTFNPRRFGNYVTDGARRILSATSITSAKMLESAILALQKLDHARCLSSDISEGLLYAIWPCFHVLGDDFVDDETLKSYFPGIFCSTANTTHEMDLQAKLSDFRESLADIFARNDITLGLKDSAGRSFLHLAAASGLHAFLNQILAQGYDVNIQDSEGQAPLHFAADQGDRDTMRILLRAGATTDTKTKRGMTPLHFAVYHSKDRGVLQELLAHGADVNVVNELGETALHLAALLEAPDTDESELDDSDNDSATDAASEDSPSNRIDILIAYGSNIDAKTTTGQTAIHYAARNPQGGEVIEQLIRYGLDVHAVDVFGCSALIFAAESPNVETTVVLLMHEVDVDVVGILGSTALGAAVAGGRKEHAMVLLHAGADPDIPNCYGSSVRSYIENSDYWKSTIELPERANPPEVINKAHHIRANMTRRLQLLLDNFSDPCFGREIGYRLHKQLLALGDWNAAVTALTFFLTRRDDSERISFVCQCTACLASTELQFSCRECEATVICNDCFTNLPITDLPWCDGHNFIKVNGNMRLKLEEMYGGKENAYFNFLREVLEKYWIPL